jgi:hypothetical protein
LAPLAPFGNGELLALPLLEIGIAKPFPSLCCPIEKQNKFGHDVSLRGSTNPELVAVGLYL